MQHSIYQNSQFHPVKIQDLPNNQLDMVQGRWKQLQHSKFLQAIILYGKDWKKVEDYVGTRSGSQVRSHAQKYFIKIVKIMKDRKKLKGRKIPDITETEKELAEYFKENNPTQNTPKQVCELMKLGNLNKIKCEVKMQNGEKKQKTREYGELLQLKKQFNGIKERKKIIQSIQLECGQDESIFSSIMRKNYEYFVRGGEFSGLIDFGVSEKRLIQEEETSNRKCSFIEFDQSQNEKQSQ